MCDSGREGIQLPEGTGLGLREKAFDCMVRCHMSHIFQTWGSQDVCYHLQLKCVSVREERE